MISPLLSCLIVDDEPLAQEILIDHVNRIPFLRLAGVAYNVMEAAELIEQTRPNIILLDINLPQINGLDWIETFDLQEINVIVTTANPNYTHNNTHPNVIDYLPKPIRFEQFAKAVNRYREQLLPPS